MVRIIHISDVHIGDACERLLDDAARAINGLAPDCVIATGDLTQAGRRREFAGLARWLARIEAPLVACPGNHDAPVWHPLARLTDPFGRFARLGLAQSWASGCGEVRVEAFNTARAVQARADWSQGSYHGGLEAALARLGPDSDGILRILACHHPPFTPPGAGVESRPRGGRSALARLAGQSGLLLLGGHVHGAHRLALGRGAELVTAPSLSSSRQRGARPGFNVLEVALGQVRSVAVWQHHGSGYQPSAVLHPEGVRQMRLQTGSAA
jgi:3',5'-cyclic AMP phosphodiesterase CpdA